MAFFGKVRFIVLSSVFGVLAVAMTIAAPIVVRNGGAALNMVFNTKNYITLPGDDDEVGETYFESDRDYLKGS